VLIIFNDNVSLCRFIFVNFVRLHVIRVDVEIELLVDCMCRLCVDYDVIDECSCCECCLNDF
jgi:hypothetical protein